MEAEKYISKTKTYKKNLPQSFRDRLFRRPVECVKEEYISRRPFSSLIGREISPELKSEGIIESISKQVEDTRMSLHEKLTKEYDLRKAKRILGVETSPKKPEIYIDDSHFPL